MTKRLVPSLALVLTLVLALGLVIAACGASGGGGVTPTESASAEPTGEFDGGTITISAPITLTGSGAMNGVEQKWAYDEAVKDKNAAGGILMGGKHYKVEIKYYDDAADMTQVSSVMEQLIKVDGLKLI